MGFRFMDTYFTDVIEGGRESAEHVPNKIGVEQDWDRVS